jgi:hypothetical protein
MLRLRRTAPQTPSLLEDSPGKARALRQERAELSRTGNLLVNTPFVTGSSITTLTAYAGSTATSLILDVAAVGVAGTALFVIGLPVTLFLQARRDRLLGKYGRQLGTLDCHPLIMRARQGAPLERAIAAASIEALLRADDLNFARAARSELGQAIEQVTEELPELLEAGRLAHFVAEKLVAGQLGASLPELFERLEALEPAGRAALEPELSTVALRADAKAGLTPGQRASLFARVAPRSTPEEKAASFESVLTLVESKTLRKDRVECDRRDRAVRAWLEQLPLDERCEAMASCLERFRNQRGLDTFSLQLELHVLRGQVERHAERQAAIQGDTLDFLG